MSSNLSVTYVVTAIISTIIVTLSSCRSNSDNIVAGQKTKVCSLQLVRHFTRDNDTRIIYNASRNMRSTHSGSLTRSLL